jgi:hypothetical protein
MSAGAASNRWLAILTSFARILPAAMKLAPPAITSERLANVPKP